MLYLDQSKFNAILAARGLNLSQFAKVAHISRQSLYNLFKGESIFNSTMEKILENLNVPLSKITIQMASIDTIMVSAPTRIRMIALELIKWSKRHQATLILFGSRARGEKSIRADWDFGIYSHQLDHDKQLRLLKQKLQNDAFPYRIDIADLTNAPKWFLHSIANDYIVISGNPLPPDLFKKDIT